MLEPGDRSGHLRRWKNELIINLVGKHKNAARQCPAHNLGEFAIRVDRARGIAGGIENQQPGFVRGPLLKHERRHLEFAFRSRMHGYRHAPGKLDHVRIAQPVGRRDQHFVAGIERGLQKVVETMLGRPRR